MRRVSAVYFILLIIGCNNHISFSLNKIPEDQSVNEILDEEIKPVLVNEHHYYLPQQTVFGSPGSSMGIDASKTSPPQLTINPSTTKNIEHNTATIKKDSDINDDHIIPYSSYCVSETTSNIKDESEILLPSRDMLQKNVVLSGYVETPSKTSDDYPVSEVSNHVSVSSDVAQENKIFIGNTSSNI